MRNWLSAEYFHFLNFIAVLFTHDGYYISYFSHKSIEIDKNKSPQQVSCLIALDYANRNKVDLTVAKD